MLTLATAGACSPTSSDVPAGGHWLAGFVYGGEADSMTFEWQVIRYRLVIP